MNNARRKELSKVINMLNEAKDVLEDVLYEEQDVFDNMPENLKFSMKGQDMENAVARLEDALNDVEDAIDCIIEAQVQIVVEVRLWK